MPTVSITKVFTFDAAHSLRDYQGPCENIHGHTYKLEVTVKGKLPDSGLVMDFTALKDAVETKIIHVFDHRYLNDLVEFNPTCENLLVHFWNIIHDSLHEYPTIHLEEITLWETPTARATLSRADLEES